MSLRKKQVRGKAILYARTSTSAQSESVQAQLRRMRNFAKNSGLVIVSHLIGKGVTPDPKKTVDALIERKKTSNDFDTVVLNGADRLARTTADSVSALFKLNGAGIDVVPVE